jgi:hypothetical protein
MSRFASLSSPSSRVRGNLQARLYYAREKNRNLRKAANAPISLNGAIVGDISDTGSLPTGWQWEVGFDVGLTLEVLEISNRDGHQALTIKISGTNTSGSTQYPGIRVTTEVAAEDEEFTFSVLAELLDESDPLMEDPRISIQSRLDNSYLSVTNTVIPSTWDNAEVVHTVAATANQAIAFLLDNSLDNGESVDVTFQVAMIKMKRTG